MAHTLSLLLINETSICSISSGGERKRQQCAQQQQLEQYQQEKETLPYCMPIRAATAEDETDCMWLIHFPLYLFLSISSSFTRHILNAVMSSRY